MAKKKRVDKRVEKALALAKRLEKLAPHGKKTISREHREALEAAARLQKLLKPSWYLGKDIHRKKKAGKKSKRKK